MVPNFEKYTYKVTWSEDDGEFLGLCVEFPGLSWLAETSEDTLKGIHSVVKICIEDMLENDESVPLPVSLRHYSGKFMVRIPPDVHRNLALEAIETGVSLNRIASAKLAH